MKLERAALWVALPALILTGWSALEIRNLQKRLDNFTDQTLPHRRRIDDAMFQPTNSEPRLKMLEAASGGLGGIMLGVQLHFSKLYFASEARNWDLARFEHGEIEEKLNAAAALRPEERGVGLVGIIDAFKSTQLAALKDAIDVKDRGLFRDAYRQSVLMCNACHQATGRPFITIKLPTSPPVANQQWEPPILDGK